MDAAHLSNEEFLSRLSDLITSTTSKSSGSIFLSQKPLLHTSETTTSTKDATEPFPDLEAQPSSTSPPKDCPLLVRATNGNPKKEKSTSKDGEISLTAINKKQQKEKRVKLSTIVATKDLDAFFAKYAEVAKAWMGGANGGLRKRDRTKRKKKKATAGVEKR